MNYRRMTKKELITMLELMEKPIQVNNPQSVFDYLKPYGKEEQEHFIVVMLNGGGQIKNIKIVSVGLANKTLVHPREVFAPVIENRATAVIVAHNHPSGNIQPSNEDFEVTARLKKAGEILGVQVFDHIVFSAEKYYSFSEHEQMTCL